MRVGRTGAQGQYCQQIVLLQKEIHIKLISKGNEVINTAPFNQVI